MKKRLRKIMGLALVATFALSNIVGFYRNTCNWN